MFIQPLSILSFNAAIYGHFAKIFNRQNFSVLNIQLWSLEY